MVTTTRWLVLSLLCVGVASCSTSSGKKRTNKSKEYFSESEYGVKASPRVADGAAVPKGGGRFLVGKPYTVRGKRYVPKENPGYDKVGLASWYGSAFHGRLTANGEVYDQYHLSAAHPTMPLPSYARVTNVENGTSVIVRVNDRGPFHSDRLIDISDKTAELLDMKHSGTAKVRVQYVGPARMDGHDMPFLMASYERKGDRFPQINPEGQIASGVMVASNSTAPIPMPRDAALGALPVAQPAIQTSLSGPTPDLSFNSDGPSPGFAVVSDAFDEFLLLPPVGPELIERPLAMPRQSFASAYVAVGAPDGSGAFEAILVRNDDLSADAIKAFAERRGLTRP